MAFNLILFYVFAAIAVGATLLVVVQSNPVYSVLLLIASFIGLAGLYVTELLAIPVSRQLGIGQHFAEKLSNKPLVRSRDRVLEHYCVGIG